MLVMFLVVLGCFAFFNLGVDLFPKADAPVVNVIVRLPGASVESRATASRSRMPSASVIVNGFCR